MVDPQAMAEDSLIEEDFLFKLKANGLSDSTLINYAQAVKTLRILNKDPSNLEDRDIERWAVKLQEKYAESSQSLYKSCVKKYMKWLKTGELNGEEYPDCVKDLKPGDRGKRLPKEILSHEEVKKLAKQADRQRDRAMIWAGYESGSRASELLNVKIKDLEFDRYGAQVMVDGKTGERRIRLVESVPDLKLWLSMHPEGEDPGAYLWYSSYGGHLTNKAWGLILKKIAKKAEIKKRVYPHLLRHSRATHLAAKGINEAQMREIFGWTKNSDMPSVYVHLSGRDTDSALLDLYGIKVSESENQLEMGVKECPFCNHENSPNAKFCEECNGPLDSVVAERTDENVREQDRLTKKVLEKLIDRAPEILEKVLKEEEISSEVQRLAKAKA